MLAPQSDVAIHESDEHEPSAQRRCCNGHDRSGTQRSSDDTHWPPLAQSNSPLAQGDTSSAQVALLLTQMPSAVQLNVALLGHGMTGDGMLKQSRRSTIHEPLGHLAIGQNRGAGVGDGVGRDVGDGVGGGVGASVT
jgi:hypothetical protein